MFPRGKYRVYVVGGIILSFYLLLILRLGVIQLINNFKYSESIATQSIRKIRMPGFRGKIFTSDGNILADNIPCYEVVFHLAEMRKYGSIKNTIDNIYQAAQRLAQALNKKLDVTREDVVEQINLRPAMPMVIFSDLTPSELAIASDFTPAISGMEIIAEPVRYYPYGEVACHLIGYTGKDDPSSAPDRSKYSYYIPDLKGHGGIEGLADIKINLGSGYKGLRGKAGRKLVRVNAKGYVHDDIEAVHYPKNGNNIVLTINLAAQKIATKIIKGKKASLVLLNAKTGAVIALASSPGFDPNSFTKGVTHAEWNNLLKDPSKPLLNKALVGTYMPGSIVKPLICIAALNAGVDPDTTIFCNGAVPIGNSEIHCWAAKYGGHENENMVHAIRDSCNVYFVRTGLKLGLDRLAAIYKEAGIGRKTGIELPENTGIRPSKEEKKRLTGKKWTAFDTGLISIGQGMITVTPIQVAVYTAAIANGGTILKPYLIKSIFNHNKIDLYKTIPHIIGHLPVTQKELNIIHEGMSETVNDPYGSCKKAKTDVVAFFAKSGTAQVGTPSHRYKDTWITGFFNYKNDLYVLVISVEDGDSGGTTNAPMAKEFLETWLSGDK